MMRSGVELAPADPAGCDKRPAVSRWAAPPLRFSPRVHIRQICQSDCRQNARIGQSGTHRENSERIWAASSRRMWHVHAPRESAPDATMNPAGRDKSRGGIDWVVLRPRRNGRGAGAWSGRARSVDRVGPSVEAAGEAADVAMSGAAHRIDGEIAGAAVGAAIGSAGRGRAAPQTAVRHASARDRHGRGTRIQYPVPYWSRVSRAHIALNAASRPWFAR